MCKYMTTQEFKCTSGHRFGRTRVSRTQSSWATCGLCTGVVFCVPWLRSSFAARCCLGVMMWFIISKETLETEISQQHHGTEDCLTVQESCRINLEASFIFQIASVFLFLSLFSHFTFLVSLEMSENWKSTWEWGKPSTSRQRWKVSGCQQVPSAVVSVSRLRVSHCLWGYCDGTGVICGAGILITRGLEAALVMRSAVKSSLAFCVIAGAQQDYYVAPESCTPILILGTQMRRGALAAQLLLFTWNLWRWQTHELFTNTEKRISFFPLDILMLLRNKWFVMKLFSLRVPEIWYLMWRWVQHCPSLSTLWSVMY